jgi:hypothetical protein
MSGIQYINPVLKNEYNTRLFLPQLNKFFEIFDIHPSQEFIKFFGGEQST